MGLEEALKEHWKEDLEGQEQAQGEPSWGEGSKPGHRPKGRWGSPKIIFVQEEFLSFPIENKRLSDFHPMGYKYRRSGAYVALEINRINGCWPFQYFEFVAAYFEHVPTGHTFIFQIKGTFLTTRIKIPTVCAGRLNLKMTGTYCSIGKPCPIAYQYRVGILGRFSTSGKKPRMAMHKMNEWFFISNRF